LMSRQRWLSVGPGVAASARPSVREAKLLNAALANVSRGRSFKLPATDSLTQAQAIVQGAPLSPHTAAPGSRTAAALVWVIPLTPTPAAARDLAQLFALSAAEERLLEQLLLTDDLTDVAEALRISIHTARSQLKAIFSKTGRRTQAQLLMLATRIASIRSL
jgi:DNA-binding CsgD family transcriptional regulator